MNFRAMIGIVAAFEDEIKGFLKQGSFKVTENWNGLKLYESTGMPRVVAVSGAIGKEAAQLAASEMIETFQPKRIVSAGFAGGAVRDARNGDVYLCDRLVSVEGPAAFWTKTDAREQVTASVMEIGAAEPSLKSEYQVRIKYGSCLSAPRIISSGSMKEWIGSTFSVSVIDLESFWVCEKAASRGVPAVVVRAVFDSMEQDLPDFISDAVEQGEGQPVGRALRHLLSKPVDTPKMVRLANQSKAASKSLGSFLSRYVEQAR